MTKIESMLRDELRELRQKAGKMLGARSYNRVEMEQTLSRMRELNSLLEEVTEEDQSI